MSFSCSRKKRAILAGAAALVVCGWSTLSRTGAAVTRLLVEPAGAQSMEVAPAVSDQDLLNALVQRPDDPAILAALGDLYRKQGQMDAAGACYLKILRIDPAYSHINCRLALAAAEASPALALSYARNELTRAPNCADAQLIVRRLGAAAGSGAGSPEDVTTELIQRDDEKLAADCAELLLEHEPEKAAVLLSHEIHRFSGSGRIAYDLGKAYAGSNAGPEGLSRAATWLEVAERLSGRREGLHRTLANIYLQMGRDADAEREARAGIAEIPYDGEAEFLLSECLRREHRPGAAAAQQRFVVIQEALKKRAALESSFHRSPSDVNAAHSLVLMDLRMGDDYPALTVARFAARLHPENSQAREDLRRAEAAQPSGGDEL